MDKPITMPVKDYLVKVMSIKNNLSSSIIDAIITHQFEEANKALLSNNSVEIAGFGKFLFKEKKAIKKLENLYIKKKIFTDKANEEGISEAKKLSWSNKLSQTLKEIDILTNKLHGGFHKDTGGMEEQSSTSQGTEGHNRNEGKPQDESMSTV